MCGRGTSRWRSSITHVYRAAARALRVLRPGDGRRRSAAACCSQKVYSFKFDEKRGIVETLYQLVEPLRWRDGQLNKDVFSSIDTEDVQAEGCQLLWKKKDAGFVATHDPKVCPDPEEGDADPGGVQRRRADGRGIQVPQGALTLRRSARLARSVLQASVEPVRWRSNEVLGRRGQFFRCASSQPSTV